MTVKDTMLFQLNFKSGKPVYLQVVDQVKAAAASGALRAGEPLPSIRPLAEELARQPQHGRQGLRGAREPGRHRDHRRQGLLPSSEQRPRSGRTSGSSCWPRRSTRPSCRPITCRWSEAEVPGGSSRSGSTRSNEPARATRRNRD